MTMIRGWSAPFLALALAGACLAQDAVPAKFYKLDFVVKEVEGGKVLNARTYSLAAAAELKAHGSVRAGSKVPYVMGGSMGQTQYSFLDVGVNIDCHDLRVEAGQLSLQVDANISSVLQESPTPEHPPEHPVVRDNKWSSGVIVPLKKPTVIFASDDLTTKRQMQLELTATPIT